MIRFEMQNGKTIDIELCKEDAPITAANFEKLVKEGFFDGTHFHRIIPGFVIQAAILPEQEQAVPAKQSEANSEQTA